MTYEIKLPQFEGPFDLILYFIDRNELDINDIPIAKITEDFLHYLQKAKELNIELASEFIVVAATLVRIKARLLIPRVEIDEETGEEIDPRKELIAKLIEYKKFKEACKDLADLEEARMFMLPRGNTRKDIAIINNSFTNEFELENLTLFKLYNTFQSVMDRFENSKKAQHNIVKYDYTIKGEKQSLISLVKSLNGEPKNFKKVFSVCKDALQCIFRFLAMLEIVQERIIKLVIGEGVNNFWLEPVISNGSNK